MMYKWLDADVTATWAKLLDAIDDAVSAYSDAVAG